MKKPLLPLLAVLLIFSPVRSQEVIKNPDRPSSKNSGRIVKLERLLSIKGAGPNDLFRGPYDIQVGNDGSIYFYDYFEFYKFSPEGKFLFKVVRPGQGPGEAQMKTVAAVTDDQIIIQAWSPPKVMWFDQSGNLKDEKRMEQPQRLSCLFPAVDSLYGFDEGEITFSPDIKEGYMDVPTTLFEITPDVKRIVAKTSFPIQNYMLQGGGAWFQSLFLEYVLKGEDTLFISHTVDYKLVKYDLKLNTIKSTFGRKYQRVARPEEKRPPRRPGAMEAPRSKYFVDISTLLIYGDRLWVVTSTRDPQQNRLVDVYDLVGHYLDNFFLQYPEGISHDSFYRNVALRGDRLYSIDEEKDGTMSVNVYRIRN